MERHVLHPETLHPEGGGGAWARPYSHVISVETRSVTKLVFISGQLGIDRKGNVVGEPGDLRAQFRQAYENLRHAVEAAGGTMQNIVQLRTYLTSRADLERFNRLRDEFYPQIFPDGVHPTNTLLIIDGLFRVDTLLEIEAIACI